MKKLQLPVLIFKKRLLVLSRLQQEAAMANHKDAVCAGQTGQGGQEQMAPGDNTPASNSELVSTSTAAELAHAQAQVRFAYPFARKSIPAASRLLVMLLTSQDVEQCCTPRRALLVSSGEPCQC